MSYKILKLLLILPLIIKSNHTLNKASISESISIKGSIQLLDLYQEMPISLNMEEGHPYAYVNINIYVNGTLEVSKQELTKYISQSQYYISSFTSYKQRKDVTISVNYLDDNVAASICNFTIYGPEYGVHESNYLEDFSTINDMPVSVEFSMKGNNATIREKKEGITFEGNPIIDLVDNRFLDFSRFSIQLIGIQQNIETCEVRFYTKFHNSDMLYKDDYTTIDVSLRKTASDLYTLNNEYKYYINMQTGMINETQTSSCDDELLPFFFPLSFGINKTVLMEIRFHDIGWHHNDYVLQSKINLLSDKQIDVKEFGSVLNYKYVALWEILQGVLYE